MIPLSSARATAIGVAMKSPWRTNPAQLPNTLMSILFPMSSGFFSLRRNEAAGIPNQIAMSNASLRMDQCFTEAF